LYINWKRKELVITVALYGPQASGKTTTWRWLAQGADRSPSGDTFGLHLDDVRGKRVILHVRDTPGGEDAARRRRIALYGVDGLIFVADSDGFRQEANRQTLEELETNLRAMKKSIHQMPFIFQYNKRDLDQAVPVRQIQEVLNPDRIFPYQETCATREEGLVEILKQATDLVLTTVLE
jgi:hypothetical protein